MSEERNMEITPDSDRSVPLERRVLDDRRLEYRGGRRSTDACPAPLTALTTKQRRLLEAIDDYQRLTGEACQASYLARRFSAHHTTVREHLQALYRRGWLSSPNSPASLRQPMR